MKVIINGQYFQIMLYWASIKALIVALTSVLRLIVPFVTVLLTLLAAPEIHRLLSLIGW